jgi:hypothetical protein
MKLNEWSGYTEIDWNIYIEIKYMYENKKYTDIESIYT